MPVIQISTPNLAADIASIASITATILGNAPIAFDSFINPCFKLKPTQDCDAMILHDFTDYQELTTIDLNDVVITFSYGMSTDCGCAYICSGLPFTPESQYTLENLGEDACYGASIELQYTDNTDPMNPIVYNKTIMVSYEKDCCGESFKELACTILNKMNCIANTICSFKKIGRKIFDLKESYLKLSNLYWLYCNSKEPCNDRDQVYCLFNKIK